MKKDKLIKGGLVSIFIILALLLLLYSTPLFRYTPLQQPANSLSKETFTIVGEVPTTFRLDIISYYQRDRVDECLRYSAAAGRKISYQTGIKQTINVPNNGHYQVKVSTSYHAEGCHLPIQSVKIIAFGHYGKNLQENSMEQWGASLSLVDSAQLEITAPHFMQGQPKTYRSACTWFFRLMADNSLLKMLNCYAADEQWQIPEDKFKQAKVYDVLRRDEVANQIITINFRLTPKYDKPYFEGSWLKTENGWKPCYGKGENYPFGFCYNSSGKYKTFKMNGKTCTIYPNCTED